MMKPETEAKIRELSGIFAANFKAGMKKNIDPAEKAALYEEGKRGYGLEQELCEDLGFDTSTVNCVVQIVEFAEKNGSNAAQEIAAVMPAYLALMIEINKINPEGTCPTEEAWKEAKDKVRKDFSFEP